MSEEDLMSPEARAKRRVADIIERQTRLVGQVSLSDGTLIDFSEIDPLRVADAFFQPHSNKNARIKGLHQSIAQLMIPDGNHEAAIEWLTSPAAGSLGGGNMPFELVQAIIDASKKDWAGPGWSASEREALKRRTGAHPQNWELGPGDHLAHQRMLDYDYLQRIDEAVNNRAPTQSVPSVSVAGHHVSGFQRPAREYNSQRQYEEKLIAARADYDKARSEAGKFASGTFGSVYPWRQMLRGPSRVGPRQQEARTIKNRPPLADLWNAGIADALQNTDSPIARYISKSSVLSDAAAYAGMSSNSPLTSASTTAETRDLSMGTSPDVPDGSPEDRVRYLSQVRNALTAASAPDYSDWRYATYGRPPSYLGQGTMNVINAFVDASPLGVAAAPKIVGKVATGLARTGLPLVSQYGSHIANKTMQGAATPFGRLALGEVREDVPTTSAIMGASAMADQKMPAVSQWLSSGIENRPDMTAETYSRDFSEKSERPMQGMSKGDTSAYFKQQAEDRARALKFLEQENMRHRESYLSRSDLPSAAARAVGEGAYALWEALLGATKTQKNAGGPQTAKPVPFLFTR